MSDIKLYSHIIALITIIFWSLTFVQTKVLLSYFSPVEILIYRFFIAWLIFLLIYPKFVKNTFKEELLFLFLGLSGIFAYYIFENLALKFTSATNVGLIVTATPVFTALLLLKKASKKEYLKIFTGFAFVAFGLYICMHSGITQFNKGDILAMLGAISFSIYSVLLSKADKKYSLIIITRKSFFWGIVFLIFYAVIGNEKFHMYNLNNYIALSNLLTLAVIASAICFLMWRFAISNIGSAKASNYIYLVPIINAFAAFLILNEKIGLNFFIATFFIISGLIIAQKTDI